MRSTTVQVHVAAATLCVLTGCIRFLALVGFPNDHFLYLAPAQQMLAGELPSRDFVDPGAPLMYAVSAIAGLVVDSPLLAEALVVCAAFGLAAALTVYAGFLASGSLSLAVIVTMIEIAMFPRSYHYPKLVLLAAGVVAMWVYARDPRVRRAILLAATVVIAFLFRHDLGLYLAAAALLTAALARPGRRGSVERVLLITGLIGVLVLPYLWFVESTTGLARHFGSGIAYSREEAARTMLRRLPRFDLSALQSENNALTALFYMFHVIPIMALGVLAWPRIRGTTPTSPDWRYIAPVAVLAIVANVAFLRDPLVYRLPDVAVPAFVLAAWLVPHAVRCSGLACFAGRGLLLVMVGVSILGVNVVGAPAEQVDRAELLLGTDRVLAHARERFEELQAPFSPRQFPSRTIEALVPVLEYVGRCTTPDHRLFVAGNAPEIYVYARRLFGGGQPALRAGFFDTIADQRRLVLTMRQQPVLLAFVLSEGDAELFPLVMVELKTEFRSVGQVPVEGQGTVSVLVSRRGRPTGIDAATGFPCFA